MRAADQNVVNRLAWAGGVAAGCWLVVAGLYALGVFETLELKTLDTRFRLIPRRARSGTPGGVVVVAIDQDSIESVHRRIQQRWPWPRVFYARIIDFARDCGARAVVFDMFFTEPDINRLDIPGEESDRELVAATARAGRVYHAGVLQKYGLPPAEDELAALADQMDAAAVGVGVGDDGPGWERFAAAALPSAALTGASRLVGFANLLPERDNVLRRVPIAARLADRPLFSLAFAAAWDLNGRKPLRVAPGKVHWGETVVPVDAASRFFLWWYKPPPDRVSAFTTYPADRVLRASVQREMGQTPEIPPAALAGKTVIIGSTAPGLFDRNATPLSRVSPGVEVQATALANLLEGRFVRPLPRRVTLGLLFVMCAAVALWSLRLRYASAGLVATLVALAALLGAGLALLAARGVFLDVVPATVGGLLTFLSATYLNYVSERRHARLVRRVFEHYLDRSVVKTLISRPDQVRLGGERRHCTVLFSDVAGFTHMSERLYPEQVVQFMNVYLDAMTDIIIGEGGFLDKFVGDEIVAIFGAPHQVPDHAVRACRAALAMRRRLAELQPQFAAIGCPGEVFARTGISSGDIVVGNMGSENRMNYTGMGDVVNLGARLEAANKAYRTRILLSAATAEEAAAAMTVRELDTVRVKGKQAGVPVFELVGESGRPREDDQDVLDRYAEGLKAYRARAWAEAETAFAAASALGDGPAAVMAARCRGFAAAPPPPDWDGVHDMQP